MRLTLALLLEAALASGALKHRYGVSIGNTLNTLLQQWDEQAEEPKATTLLNRMYSVLKQGSAYPEKWYSQTKDHYGGVEGEWKQRYFQNNDNYKKGGPVFLMIGGEGPISADYVGGKFLAQYMAEKWGGAVLALEHRFYGESLPNGHDVRDLSLLHSRQALADLAQFNKWIRDNEYPDSKFICLGGSYPGNLAAWYRQLYPDVVQGCLSFSAPMYAKMDFFEYGQMVHTAIGSSYAERLHNGYEAIMEDLAGGTLAMKKKILKDLNACPFSVLSTGDIANVESVISGAVAGAVQYNNTLAEGMNIAGVRAIVDQFPDDDVKAAWEVSKKWANLGNQSQCTDYSIRDTYAAFVVDPKKFNSDNSVMRSWVYQTCNEFGYFQTAKNSPSNRTLYTTGVSNSALWKKMCIEVFGIEDTEARIRSTRTFYDTDEVSNTVFVNGNHDPWSTLSRGVSSHPDKGYYGFVVPNGSHCVGLYGNPNDPRVIPAAKEVQSQIVKITAGWLGLDKEHSGDDQAADGSVTYAQDGELSYSLFKIDE